ncbi:hypothetical protein [Thermodesulforhabdus norvegica]|uniref:Epoxyqueuosine reductase n=1 Tax=Thermodesulforhabdus norvegica TaxID=39841 RepID=A0A1I4U708_9BACT|nr:hypothetical protein [Thermodesulforhabdus norvegica]SFM84739.1 epoxyqueuosine reductase [Thermodesulforhabdus norvegica]
MLRKENRIKTALLDYALELGADLAGFASVEQLKKCPSSTMASRLRQTDKKQGITVPENDVVWPKNAKTVMVVALYHPRIKPEMDWWVGKIDPPGNKVLARIVEGICEFASAQLGLWAFHFPYHVEKGGIYLKDAAVLAGLGCIGKNNLLITQAFGPRVRLRALALDVELSSTGPSDFDPCIDCPEWCRKACPQQAFSRKVYEDEYNSGKTLPGRTGHFSRADCYEQMNLDEQRAHSENSEKIIKYCRHCEWACPVGRL